MILSVSSIIESLSTAPERFRQLAELEAHRDRNGLPLFLCTPTTAEFYIRWHRHNYLLQCPLYEDETQQVDQQHLSAQLQQIQSPYLLEYRYFTNEMVIFDDKTEPHMIDVTLIEMPEGSMHLRDRLEELCLDRDSRQINLLLHRFCQLGIWLINHQLVHGSLRMSHIMVCPDDTLRLTHYESMKVIEESDPEYDKARDGDNEAVANIALEIKLLAAQPDNFRYLRDSPTFINQSQLPQLAQAASNAGCRPLERLIEQLSTCNQMLTNRQLLAEILEELSNDSTPVPFDLGNDRTLYTPPPSYPQGIDPQPFVQEYDWTGPPREGLICVSRDGKWGYIDTHASVCIPLQYEWCNDFNEGRAEVMNDSYYGLIDKTGHEVLPCIYEQVEWNCQQGVVKVCCDGQFGLYDRNGRVLMDFTYDWMGSLDNELILVALHGRYGYIHHDGTLAIALRYRDAYDFQDDRALVAIGKRTS